jgi:hypothetical protein
MSLRAVFHRLFSIRHPNIKVFAIIAGIYAVSDFVKFPVDLNFCAKGKTITSGYTIADKISVGGLHQMTMTKNYKSLKIVSIT